jgi:hypothetical protein
MRVFCVRPRLFFISLGSNFATKEHFFYWAFVFTAFGIGLYFSLQYDSPLVLGGNVLMAGVCFDTFEHAVFCAYFRRF